MGADIKGQTMAALPGTIDAMNEQAGKACTKCGVLKLLPEFYAHEGCKDGHANVCKLCRRASSKAWRQKNKRKDLESKYRWKENNREKYLAKERERRSKNKERYLASHMTWIAKNPEKAKAMRRAASAKQTERMNDCYVANALRLKKADAPPELLALKREQLTIHRLARQLKEKANESSTDPR